MNFHFSKAIYIDSKPVKLHLKIDLLWHPAYFNKYELWKKRL